MAVQPFDDKVVSDAVNMLKGFAEERGAGAPIKVLTCSTWYDTQFGVGCEWLGELRNAVLLPSSSPTARGDFAEAVRRLREWSATNNTAQSEGEAATPMGENTSASP